MSRHETDEGFKLWPKAVYSMYCQAPSDGWSASGSSESRASYSTVRDQSVPVTATDGRNQLDCIAPAIIIISKSEASTELDDACMSMTEIDSGGWRAEKTRRSYCSVAQTDKEREG